MTISYSWDWAYFKDFGALYMALVGIGFMLYAKYKAKKVNKKQYEAYSQFSFFVAVVYVLLDIWKGLTIYNPNFIFLGVFAMLALALIFADGYMTQKIVGRKLAQEANPIMALLFRAVGYKTVRLAILIIMAGLLVALIKSEDLAGIMAVTMMWVMVDTNNLVVWYKIKRNLHLKAKVAVALS